MILQISGLLLIIALIQYIAARVMKINGARMWHFLISTFITGGIFTVLTLGSFKLVPSLKENMFSLPFILVIIVPICFFIFHSLLKHLFSIRINQSAALLFISLIVVFIGIILGVFLLASF